MKINLVNNDDISDEYILFNYNYLKNDINKAINIVKQYIIENKLLIVGGTAIDYALRLKNDKIYNEEYQIPDFDIISPNNVYHANQIGTILCNEKLNNISIIPAIHNTTVRVQLLGFTVFDSTFVPEYLYNKIPSIQYNNFNIIDPKYQKINQYISMSFLFNNNGLNYNISSRLEKDYKRLQKIEKYYNLIDSLDINNIEKLTLTKIKLNCNFNTNLNLKIFNKNNLIKESNIFKQTNLLINNKDLYCEINNDVCFHGILAYNFTYNDFNQLLTNFLSINKLNDEDLKFINNKKKYILINPNIKMNNNIIETEIIKELPLIIINNNNKIDEIYNNITKNNNVDKLHKYSNIIDIIPKYGKCKLNFNNDNFDLLFYDLYGDLLSINLLNTNNNIVLISNYMYNLSYLLFNYYYSEDTNIKLYYLYYYISLKSIIDIISYLNINYTKELSKLLTYENSIYNLSINTLGSINLSNNYYYFLENFKYLVYNDTNLNALPPKNYLDHPLCEIKKKFDKENSWYYKDNIEEILYTNNSQLIKDLLTNN